LDTIQAAVLDVKLKYLDEYGTTRYKAAQYYTQQLKKIEGIIVPEESPESTHVYHQYTLKVLNDKRDALKQHLSAVGIPSMVYYPLPLQRQEAFTSITRAAESLCVTEQLARSVLSLPMHTELNIGEQDVIINRIKDFF
jgi:dTDP-4-amino-4,6-dideoxygalactose transaminase